MDAGNQDAHTGVLWNSWEPPAWLSLGGSLRGAVLGQGGVRVFPMQLDTYTQLNLGRVHVMGSLGMAKVAENSANARAAYVTSRSGDSLNLISRTHWIALDLGARRDIVLRAGRLNLPFGLRVPEHNLWVRDVTRTDRESDQQHGLSLAYTGRQLRGEVMAIAGNYQIHPDRYRERGYSGFLEYSVGERVGVGVSSLVTSAAADRVSFVEEDTLRGVHGAFTRVRISKPWVLMSELDVLHTTRRGVGYVGFVQLDYEPRQGVHLLGTAELVDRGREEVGPAGVPIAEVAGQGKPQAGAWLGVDWFFWDQLDLRVDGFFRQNSGITLLLQLHSYL